MTTLHTHLQTRPLDALIPYARNSRIGIAAAMWAHPRISRIWQR